MKNHIFKTILVASAAAFSLLSTASLAQDWTTYETIGRWTINQYASSEVAGDARSCSAVSFSDHINAIRIERVAEGHLIGINGLNRDYDETPIDVEFWLDGDRANGWRNEAGFARDVAYPYDDWLSVGHGITEEISIAQALGGKQTLSMLVEVGDNPPVTTHAIADNSAVLASLENCFQAELGQVSERQQPQEGSDCPDDGPRLAGSGICQGRAINYMDNITDDSTLQTGCDWVVNEAPLPGGGYILYRATRCGDHTSTLALWGGAKAANLVLTRSAMSNGEPGGTIARVFAMTDASPEENILMRALDELDDPADVDKCHVRKPGPDGRFPADAYLVDYTPEFRKNLPQDEPNWVCGNLGLKDDSMAFWRVTGGFAWYFDMGQDAWWDIDPASLTVLTAEDLER